MATKTPTTPKKAPVKKAEAKKTCFVKDMLIPKDELKELEKKFAEGASPIEPALDTKPKTPEQIIADEYGIDAGCFIIPRLLYCILCELVRGRV